MKKRKKFHVLAVLTAVLFLVIICLLNLGDFLVAEEEPEPSDIAVVLMGGGPDRMLGAVDLYRAGWVGEIVMVKNLVQGYDLAVSQGVEIPHDTDLAREVAVQLGVPPEKIKILPGDARSTQEEALRVREYLREEEGLGSLILVTSRSHSGRSKRIFVKALDSLDREIRVISCPTRYDSFNERQWWREREDLERVFYEVVKLLNFYFREQFEL